MTGMEVYYYKVCHRKLWYYARQIRMESENEDVQIGKAIEEASYRGVEKGILIDGTINIDYVRDGVVHEVKKSRRIEEASVFQMKFYIYYLKSRGVNVESGIINYPELRQTAVVSLGEDDVYEIEKAIREIKNIEEQETPPAVRGLSFCKKCSYFDLCTI